MVHRRSIRVLLAVALVAVVSLTCGEGSGPDSNAVARVVITPHSGSIDTGDSLQLSAVAHNAAGDELAGKSFAWSSLDAALATVTAAGRVRAHWPGVARIVAQSDQKSDTARLTIQAKITDLSVTPTLDTLTALGTTVTVKVRASIGGQDYVGGRYFWELTDTTVATFWSSTEPDSQRTVQARKNGTTFLRVRELRGAVDSARIVVRQRPKNIFFPQQLRAYRACPWRLFVAVTDSFNFPVPDAVLTWSSSDTALARVDSTGLITPLAPGVDTISVQVGSLRRSAVLTITAAPTVTLGTSGANSAVTTVGRGQFALGTGSLGGGYSDAPARFSIVSSDTTILAVPSDTSIAIGGQPGFGPLHLVGRALGTVTLTPYLCDVPGSSVPFTVTRSFLALSGDLVTSARIDDPTVMLGVLTRDSTGALQYAADPVTVRSTGTDTNVLRTDSVYHHIAAGTFRSEVFFTYPDSGLVRLVVRDSTGLYVPDSTALIHVSYPPILFSDGDTLRVGMRQRVYPPNQHSQVFFDRLVGGVPVTIHLSTSDSALARLTPDSVTIPVGQNGAPIDIAGGDTLGMATITAHANRHLDGHLVVRVDRPMVTIGSFQGLAFVGESIYVQIGSWDSATFAPGYPTEDVTFNLSASDTSVVATDSATLTIRAGTFVSDTKGLHARGVGTATITATDPRAVPYAYAPGSMTPIPVVAPYLSMDSVISLGIQQNWNSYVVAYGPPQGSAITVHMKQRSPSVLSLSDTVLTIAAGEMASPWVGTGVASGVDTLVITAAGFKPDTAIVTVGPGTIYLGNWPPSVGVGDSIPEWIYLLTPSGLTAQTADTVVFTLNSNANLEFRQGGLVITTITIPAGQTYTAVEFYIKGKAAGTGTVTITSPNYTPLTQSITITP